MSKVLRALALLFLIGTLPHTAQTQTLFRGPESVAFDSLRSRYLVCNYHSGHLVQIDTSGETSYYLTGFGHLYGNCVKNDTLYVSNGVAVIGIDMATDDTALYVTLPQSASSYDGMTTDTSGYLYVVNTGGMIYRIDLDSHTYSVLVSSGLGTSTQDIIFDARHNRLLAVGYSLGAPIQGISLPDGAVTNLVNTPGNCDGITIDHVGNVYIASNANGGFVYRYNRWLSHPPELISSGHNGPAGLDYNWRDNMLAVPNFYGNTVDIIPLEFSPVFEEWQFDDAGGGDGDGILEQGETVSMSFSLVNYCSAPITDVVVTLGCDDASISVLDNETVLGTLNSLDSADNSGDPFTLEIPVDYEPRIDSLFLVLSYNGDTVDTTVIEQGLGAPRVLLVDDDDNDDIEQYFVECLSADRIPCFHWESPPSPDALAMSAYDLVIWITGDYRLPLDGDEVAAMEGYLDGGGKLFLTGQGIGEVLSWIDLDFLHNYLKSEYLSSELVTLLASEAGGDVFGAGDSVWITGTGGANNQTNTEHLAAVNGGVPEMTYVGWDHLGAVSFTGDYQVLFFGFGFEGVVNGSSRWTDRFTVFADILDFFSYQRPGKAPEVSLLTVQPGDPTHMIDHTPDFTWVFSDPDTQAQTGYQLQVGTDDDWSLIETWDSGPVAGTEQLAVYDGPPLLDGQTYYVRVRATDGGLWSAWEANQFHMNSVPTPTGLMPDDLAVVAEDTVVLVHDNPADVEVDELTYSYEVYDDEQLAVLVASASDQPSGDDPTTSWVVTTPLPQYEDYYWRVRAADGYEAGAWSAPASFILEPAYICGDADGGGSVNVGDAVYIINYIFKGGPAPDPPEAGDADCNGTINVSDAAYLVNFIFKGGPPPCCP